MIDRAKIDKVLERITQVVIHSIFSAGDPPPKDYGYPETVAEVLDDTIQYKKECLAAMDRFRRSKPWHGGQQAQRMKIRRLNRDLAKAYEIESPTVVFLEEFAHGPCYFPMGNLIIMNPEDDGRYSIVTFLHEFGHALGKNERGTCRWSINLFRKFFPKSYERLVPRGHVLQRAKENTDDKSGTGQVAAAADRGGRDGVQAGAGGV